MSPTRTASENGSVVGRTLPELRNSTFAGALAITAELTRRPARALSRNDACFMNLSPVLSVVISLLVQMRGDDFARLRARHHRHDLERYTRSAPLQYPFLEEPQVIALHELKA